MKRKFLFLLFLSLSMVFYSNTSYAKKKSPIKIRKKEIVSKKFSSAIKKSIPGSIPWGEIRIIFDSRIKYIDELTIKYYVLMRTKTNIDILYKEITYLDVFPGKGYISSVFVHPSTMKKYGNKIEAVHCEFWIGGKIFAVTDFPKKAKIKWWDKKPPKKGYLFSKYFTPFAIDAEYSVLLEKIEEK